MKIIFVYILIIGFSLTTLSCNSNLPIEEKMQNLLDEEIEDYDIRGVSATVIFPDNKIWNGVSGISHDTVSIKKNMLFAIGSVTKNVVAALTLKLVEGKQLLLDDKISKWTKRYNHVDSNITIRQLLNHTSGLYMFWDNDQLWEELKNDREKKWTPDEVLSYIKEPYFEPGEGWRYSNTNYLLLAMIIEKVTGSNLSAEFRKHFWEPLEISNAYLSLQDTLPPKQLAHVYGDNFNFGDSDKDLTFLPRNSHESITYGSSGLFFSSNDLAVWCHALFEGKVLHAQTMQEMLKFIEFSSVVNMSAYGLGVQAYTLNFSSGKKAIGHGGGNIGTTTYMVYLPEYHVSIVVMINAFPNYGADVITKGLIRTVLRELNAIGYIPYFEFFPTGFLIICISISLISIIIFIIRKKYKQING